MSDPPHTPPEPSDHHYWNDLCDLTDVPMQGGHYIGLQNRNLAVFRVNNSLVRVIDDTCPHAGGSLAGGTVHEGRVYCPWHAWSFDIETGKCPDNPTIAVKAYPVRIVDGRVLCRIE